MFKGQPCFLPWYIAQVDIDGDVTVRGHCALPAFGNLMERDFMSVWNSEHAMGLRNYLKTNGTMGVCNKCIGTLYELRGRGGEIATAPVTAAPRPMAGGPQQCTI